MKINTMYFASLKQFYVLREKQHDSLYLISYKIQLLKAKFNLPAILKFLYSDVTFILSNKEDQCFRRTKWEMRNHAD